MTSACHPQLGCLAFGSCGFPVAFLPHSSCFKHFHPLEPLALTNYLTSYMTEKMEAGQLELPQCSSSPQKHWDDSVLALWERHGRGAVTSSPPDSMEQQPLLSGTSNPPAPASSSWFTHIPEPPSPNLKNHTHTGPALVHLCQPSRAGHSGNSVSSPPMQSATPFTVPIKGHKWTIPQP